MENPLAKYTESTFEQLKDQRKEKEKQWKELAKYLMPDLLTGFESGNSTEYEKPDDSRPIFYAREMADGITAYIAPKDSPWLFYRPSDEKIANDTEVRRWAEKATRHVLAQLARSNFYDALQRYTHIGVVISTSTIFVGNNPIEGKPYFKIIHPFEAYLSENFYGDIDTVYRHIKIKAIDAVNMFAGGDLSDEIKKAADEDPTKKFDFIHATVFVDSYNELLVKYLPGGKRYLSIYKEAGQDGLASVNGFITFPYGTWRYRVDSKSVYGTGPGYDAISDVKWMNTMSRSILKGQLMAGDPPLNIPIELKGRVRYYPRGANYYEQTGRFVEPWRIGNVYQASIDGYKFKDDSVRQHFYIDFFMVLSSLTKRMTTVEVQERQGEKMLMLSTPISKFLSEGLDKILERVLEIEIVEGRLEPPPKKLMNTGMMIDYFSVLAQMQQRAAKGGMIKQGLIDISPILQVAPQTIDIVKWDDLARGVLDYNNFPVDYINDEKDVEKIRADRAKQQAKNQQMEQLADIIKATKGENNVV